MWPFLLLLFVTYVLFLDQRRIEGVWKQSCQVGVDIKIFQNVSLHHHRAQSLGVGKAWLALY